MQNTIFLCKITDSEIDSRILSLLPSERQERIAHSLRRSKVPQLYVSSMLCGYVLQKNGFSFSELRRNADGKPYVNADFFFNISHSGVYVAMAVCDRQVGLDIQKNVTISDAAAKFFLNAEEREYVASHPQTHITNLWCRKEAFLKCLGYGWSNAKANRCPIFSDKIIFDDEEYSLTDFTCIQDYFLTVCEKNKTHTDFSIKEVSKRELERFFREHCGTDPRK